jgi:hypothetical protein
MRLYKLPAIVLLTLTCCQPEQEIDWEVDNIPARLVVEGSITDELKVHTVTLKTSAEYFSNREADVVSNAIVTISSGENTFNLEENPAGSGIYQTTEEVRGEVGRLYTLNIDIGDPLNNETHFSASSVLRRGIIADTMISVLYDSPFIFNDVDTVILANSVIGYEPEPEGDYYIVNLYRNGTLLNDTVDEYNVVNDKESGMNGESLFTFIYIENFIVGDTVEMEFRSTSEAYYEFIKGIKMIANGTDPFGFSGPPANAIGNIEGGGALGFFNASAVTKVRARVIRQH